MPDATLVPKLSVSIPEACKVLGIGETLLRQQMAEGLLPFSRLGRKGTRGRILIRVADLDKLLADTTAKAVTP